ncbi:homeobox and leucine zipper protein Homez-like [Engraulis encrasicolus]|uniref:homeobox and leucine zipper protein Homez-like n=1 Tax=Engraulis encrasicolus TaxID=184585 RepID=UPI002FD59877
MKVKIFKESVSDDSTKGLPLLPLSGGDVNGSHFSGAVLNHTPMVCLPKVCEDLQFGWTYSNQLQDVDGIPELLSAFNTFPYPTSEELTTLALRTSKPLDKVKAWFMWQRIKYGISWNPGDVDEMRLKVGVPNGASKPRDQTRKNAVKIKQEVVVKLEPLGTTLPFPSFPPPLQDSNSHNHQQQPPADLPPITSARSFPTIKAELPRRTKVLKQQKQQQQQQQEEMQQQSLNKHMKTEAQLALLRQSFLHDTRPCKAEFKRLVRETGLPSQKVSKWFSVNRARLRRNRVPWWVGLGSGLSAKSEAGGGDEGDGEAEEAGARDLGDDEVKKEPLASTQMLKKTPNNAEQQEQLRPRPLPLPFVPLKALSVPLKPLSRGKPSAHALRESKFFKNILSDRPLTAYEVKSERENNTTCELPAQVLQLGEPAHPKSSQDAQGGDEEQKPLKQTKRRPLKPKAAPTILPTTDTASESLSATPPPPPAAAAPAAALPNKGSGNARASSMGAKTPRPRRRSRPRPSKPKAPTVLPSNTAPESLSATPLPPAADPAATLPNKGSASACTSSMGAAKTPRPRPRRRSRPRSLLTPSGRLRKTHEQMEQLRSFFLRCQWPTSEDYTGFAELSGLSRTDIIQWYGDTRYAVRRGQLRWARDIPSHIRKEISYPYGGKAGTSRTRSRKRRSEVGGEVSSHSSRKKKRP